MLVVSTKRYRKEIRWTQDKPDSTAGLGYDPSSKTSSARYGATTRKAIPDEVMVAVKTLLNKRRLSLKKKEHATRIVTDFINTSPRINKKLRRLYASGKVDPVDVLRKAGLIGGRGMQ